MVGGRENGHHDLNKTIEKLQSLSARYGMPSQLVSDNGPQFKSEKFQMFLKRNGIKHLTSAPYHPASNGLAECCVQSFKSAMKSETEVKPLNIKLATFLLAYRNTPIPQLEKCHLSYSWGDDYGLNWTC